jgi:hypothetical protein
MQNYELIEVKPVADLVHGLSQELETLVTATVGITIFEGWIRGKIKLNSRTLQLPHAVNLEP